MTKSCFGKTDSVQAVWPTSGSVRTQPQHTMWIKAHLQPAPCFWLPALSIQPLCFFQSDFFPNILILSGYSLARNLSIVHPQDGVQTPKADSLPMPQVSSSSISAIYLLYTWVSAHAGHIFSILLPPAPSTVCLASPLRLGSYHHLWSILLLLRPKAEIPKCLYGVKDKV